MSLTLPVGFWHVLRIVEKMARIWPWRLAVVLLSAVLIRGGFFDMQKALPDSDSLERWARFKQVVDEHASRGQVWVVPWGYFTTPMDGQQMRPVMMIVNDYLGGWFGPPVASALPRFVLARLANGSRKLGTGLASRIARSFA